MLCVRCSHPLPIRADRCSRCFALNPIAAPVAISFDDDPAPQAAITIPEPRPAPARPRARERARAGARIFAWSLDAAAVLALTSACAVLALHKGQIRYPLDFLRDTAALWFALLAALFLAWSWIFTALAARTPGMALAGIRLHSIHGGAPTPTEALARAILSLPSAALGLSGFVLALFDPRGQTLHDKLCRCVVLID